MEAKSVKSFGNRAERRQHQETQLYISGPGLRQRWGGMPISSFYDRLKRGVIPAAEYPFGPDKPFWSLAKIEALEQRAAEKEAA